MVTSSATSVCCRARYGSPSSVRASIRALASGKGPSSIARPAAMAAPSRESAALCRRDSGPRRRARKQRARRTREYDCR